MNQAQAKPMSATKIMMFSFLWIVGFLLTFYPTACATSALDAIAPGTWYAVPQSELGPVAAPYHHGTGIPGILTESSGIYDAMRQRLCVHGGGHADEADNSVYCFSLITLIWERLNTPAPFSTDDTGLLLNTGYYPSSQGLPDKQQPRAAHGYNTFIHVPEPVDKLCRMGAFSPWKASGKLLNVDCLNMSTLQWEAQVSLPGPVPIEYANNAAYDAVSGHVFFHSPSGKLLDFNPQANTWSTRSAGLPRIQDQTLLVDTKRHRLVFAGNGKVYSIDVPPGGNVTMQDKTPFMVGDMSILGGRRPGFVYDTGQDVYVWYSSDVHAPGEVGVIDPDTWLLKRIVSNGTAAPEPCVSQGTPPRCNSTYGKFQTLGAGLLSYIPTSLTQPVWFYRLDADAVAVALGRLRPCPYVCKPVP